MNDILAKPAAIATCGLFNMKRRAKEALSAQGSIEWVVIVVCIAVALIAALIYLSNEMNAKLNTVADTLHKTTGQRWRGSARAGTSAPRTLSARGRDPPPGIPNLPARRQGALSR